MKIFDIYILKNLLLATLFIALVLTFIIFLTQSLRFLEIVINAGSSGNAFWVLTSLALPRFFEVILPLSVMASTLFLYNKMSIDSELIAMRATGYSSFSLATPAIILGFGITVILWITTMWIAPKSLAQMQTMRTALKTEFSNFLFKEGVFNAVGNGLTVYIREKAEDGTLSGMMIHDTRETNTPPTTILAKRGIMIANEDGHQVIVFDGSRQSFSPKSGILQKLAFDQYTIDLPENGPARERWAEPDERTIFELLNPDPNNPRDIESAREFGVEIHRRITGPLLALAFPLIALSIFLLGPTDRRGQSKKIGLAIFATMIVQGVYLATFNMARNHDSGIILMYILPIAPIGLSLFALSSYSVNLRRKFLYPQKGITP